VRFTDEALLGAWQDKGGRFECDTQEMALIPKDALVAFLQELTAVPERAMVVEPCAIHAGHPGVPDKVWRLAQRLANELGSMSLPGEDAHG
jgi:hypothetical protein